MTEAFAAKRPPSDCVWKRHFLALSLGREEMVEIQANTMTEAREAGGVGGGN